MIIADTSVWINFQRQPKSPGARVFDALLAADEVALIGPVLTEVLRGARNEREYRFYKDYLAFVHYIEADRQTWLKAGEIAHHLDRIGERVALGDILVATFSVQHNMPLYALDGDFDKIELVQKIPRYMPA